MLTLSVHLFLSATGVYHDDNPTNKSPLILIAILFYDNVSLYDF